jgi:hypothetical protein
MSACVYPVFVLSCVGSGFDSDGNRPEGLIRNIKEEENFNKEFT